jgi:hypothetical protein
MLPWFQYGDHSDVLSNWRKVRDAEDSTENVNK